MNSYVHSRPSIAEADAIILTFLRHSIRSAEIANTGVSNKIADYRWFHSERMYRLHISVFHKLNDKKNKIFQWARIESDERYVTSCNNVVASMHEMD